MSSPRLAIGRISEHGRIYAVTALCHRRRPLFLDPLAAGIVADEMRRLAQEGIVANFAWVLMPDHRHWLFSLRAGSLAGCLQRMKGRSARAINRSRGGGEPVWQAGDYDHALRHEEALRDHAEYIVLNPVRADLVSKIGGHAHWWCAWDLGGG